MGDIRDRERLTRSFCDAHPEIVLHLAAQPIVRDSYRDPAGTYETNVMGTVNLLECVRRSGQVRSVLNVTTDKVYHNNEWPWGYRENEPLDGFHPYSNSKSCSELVTHCYHNSFLPIPMWPYPQPGQATSSAGEILPTTVLSQRDCVTTGELVELFCREWGGRSGNTQRSEDEKSYRYRRQRFYWQRFGPEAVLYRQQGRPGYYIGSMQARPLRSFIEAIRDEIDPSIQPNFGAVPFRGPGHETCVFDCGKLMADTDYRPQVPFEQVSCGVRKKGEGGRKAWKHKQRNHRHLSFR